MVKSIFIFLVVWVGVSFSIGVLRQMSGKEVWSMTKLFLYGGLTAIIALIIISCIVILF